MTKYKTIVPMLIEWPPLIWINIVSSGGLSVLVDFSKNLLLFTSKKDMTNV